MVDRPCTPSATSAMVAHVAALALRVTSAIAVPSVDLVFDREPQERGLTFERREMRPVALTIAKKEYQAWAARRAPNVDGMGWMKSVRLHVTDERFREGRMPVVDIEIEYLQEANVEVCLYADTARGSVRVGSRWGGGRHWQTLRAQLDDAFFGAREHGTPGNQLGSDGFDLVLYGMNTDLHVRAVRVRGYDRREAPDWTRLLRLRRVDADAPVFLFQPRDAESLRFDLRNLALVGSPFACRLAVMDAAERSVFRDERSIAIPPESERTVEFRLDTRDWPLGPYTATLEAFPAGSDTPALTREVFFGLTTPTPLAKAREGEFLFGLDVANASGEVVRGAEALAFAQAMGVDILRNIGNGPESPDAVEAAVRQLAGHDLRTMLMVDPPKETDAAKRKGTLAKKVAFLEETARRVGGNGPGRVRYFELGNEPDLPFFYPGPIDSYVEDFQTMHDAIKRGSAAAGRGDRETVVMNGGLCFHGADGDRRARRLVELMPQDRPDAWAYHGHGPGVKAEREALDRMRAAATAHGKAGRSFVETETGFAANSHAARLIQANTVVEKFAYALSQPDVPALFFFRLFMDNDGAYGMTRRRREPLPSVLAYRTLVEHLRHHRFLRAIDTATQPGGSGIHLLLFAHQGDDIKATGRMALIAWNEKPDMRELLLRLCGDRAEAGAVRRIDRFGNGTDAAQPGPHLVRLRVGKDPQYLVWQASDEGEGVRLEPAILAMREMDALPTGVESTVSVTVRNPGAEPMEATLETVPTARVSISVSPERTALTLAGGETQTVALRLTLGESPLPLALPKWWRVYPDVEVEGFDPAALAELPEALPGSDGKPSVGVDVWCEDGILDLGRIFGGTRERRPAVVAAWWDSPAAGTFPAAASADWWMAWYCNGKPVYDTLATGNRHGSLADHAFELPLQAGRNVLVAQVLSGSSGWVLQAGGARERAQSLGRPEPDRLELALRGAAGELASASVGLEVTGPLPSLPQAFVETEPAAWLRLEPLAKLGEAQIRNVHQEHPDQTRWYQGDTDLSAMLWLRAKDAWLHVAILVTDNDVQLPPEEGRIDDHDHVRLVLADDGGIVRELRVAKVADRAVLAGEHEQATASVTRIDDGALAGRTFYHVRVPLGGWSGRVGRVAVEITDRDGDTLKQALRFGDPSSPERGPRFRFPSSAHP